MNAERQASLVHQFAKIARPLMVPWMGANSCIAASRTVIEAMKVLGLKSEALPVGFVFEVPAREYTRISGFSVEERARVRSKARNWQADGDGWSGHLIVIVEDRWILDASIDQADAPQFGVSVPPEVLVIDTKDYDWDRQGFVIRLGVLLDNGDLASVQYYSSDDRTYLQTEAWKDEGLPLLACCIVAEMGC